MTQRQEMREENDELQDEEQFEKSEELKIRDLSTGLH